MSRLRKGEQVAAVTDIGGFARDFVPAGSEGTVVDDGGWGGEATVLFTIPGGWFSSEKKVRVRVADAEVR